MAFTTKHLKNLVAVALRYDASDIHIRCEETPCLRIRGDLVPVQSKSLMLTDVLDLCSLLLNRPKTELQLTQEIDGSFDVDEHCRLRFNIFQYGKNPGVVFRLIKKDIPSIDGLGLDHTLKKIALLHRGLVLVTGATGSGKSTTLAAMIDYINKKRAAHIISIEDPIEYLHQSKKSRVTQREIGEDTSDFSVALRAALRQDPDVILIGEMRDTETISTAIKAAETGHLVLSTMHTKDAPTTIGRIIGMFPAEEQADLRLRLSETLKATVGQRMLRGLNESVVVAQEIMMNNPGIKECIAGAEDIGKIQAIIERGSGRSGNGSKSFDQSIMDLYLAGKISKETALDAATSSSDFLQKLIIEA